MNKKILFSALSILVIIIISLAICFTVSNNRLETVNLEEKIMINEDLSLLLKNNTAKIFLKGNITTGYTWTYELNNDLIIVSEETYEPIATSNTLVGSGGSFIFDIKSLKAGIADISFKYLRTFQENSTIKEYTLTFVIDENLNIQIK